MVRFLGIGPVPENYLLALAKKKSLRFQESNFAPFAPDPEQRRYANFQESRDCATLRGRGMPSPQKYNRKHVVFAECW